MSEREVGERNLEFPWIVHFEQGADGFPYLYCERCEKRDGTNKWIVFLQTHGRASECRSIPQLADQLAQTAAERDKWKAQAEAYEATLRVYGHEKNWKSPKGSLAIVVWNAGHDFASKGLGYLMAQEVLERFKALHPPQEESTTEPVPSPGSSGPSATD